MRTCVCCGTAVTGKKKYCASCRELSSKTMARIRNEKVSKIQIGVMCKNQQQFDDIQYLIKSLKVSLHILEDKKYFTPEIIEKALYYYNDFIDGEL